MRGINRFTLLSGRGGAPQIVAAPCKKVGEIRLRCEMPEERDRDGDARNLAACKIRLTDLRRAGEHAHGCKNRVDFSALLTSVLSSGFHRVSVQAVSHFDAFYIKNINNISLVARVCFHYYNLLSGKLFILS